MKIAELERIAGIELSRIRFYEVGGKVLAALVRKMAEGEGEPKEAERLVKECKLSS